MLPLLAYVSVDDVLRAVRADLPNCLINDYTNKQDD